MARRLSENERERARVKKLREKAYLELFKDVRWQRLEAKKDAALRAWTRADDALRVLKRPADQGRQRRAERSAKRIMHILNTYTDRFIEAYVRSQGSRDPRRDRKATLLRVGQPVHARFSTRVMPSYAYIAEGSAGKVVEVFGRTAKSRRYRVRWVGHEGETGWYDAEALVAT